jgi:hypothetical protein
MYRTTSISAKISPHPSITPVHPDFIDQMLGSSTDQITIGESTETVTREAEVHE